MLFYANNVNINPNSNLILNNFRSFIVQGSMNVTNASFTFNPSAATSNISQFSIGTKAYLNLVNATFSTKTNLLNNNIISSSNSTFSSLKLTNTYKITNENGKMNIDGDFYNIGQIQEWSVNNPSSLASLQNNNGDIVVNGDFYNGGKLTSNADCRVYGCGGGSIISYGGSISINGKLVNKTEDNIKSSISLYGTTLKALGGVENGADSSITFGFHNGVLGNIEGDLQNNGKLIVDTKGASIGSYKLVSGNLSGDSNFSLINQSGGFIDSSIINGNLVITENKANIEKFTNSLSANHHSILNMLDSSINNIFSYGDSTFLNNEIKSIDKSLSSSYITLPYTLFDTFRDFTMSEGMRLDARGGILSGFSGGVGGVEVSYGIANASNLFAISMLYSYLNTKDNISSLSSNAFGFKLYDNISFGDFRLSLGLFGSFGDFKNTSSMLDLLSFDDSFMAYNILLDSTFAYEIKLGGFSLTPKLSLINSLYIREGLDNPKSRLKSSAFSNYMLNLGSGILTKYHFKNGSSIFANVGYEYNIYNSNIMQSFSLDNNPWEHRMINNPHRILAKIGGEIGIKNAWFIKLEGVYKYSEISYIGGSASLKYIF